MIDFQLKDLLPAISMAKEIERKFIVRKEIWRENNSGKLYRQGYLHIAERNIVRVRVVGDKGFLTIKGSHHGAVRDEFEYEIPRQDAEELLQNLCMKPFIEKIRYPVEYDGMTWEVDKFEGDNEGLLIAEIELEDENQDIKLPEWVGAEVTGDPRYLNANLALNPYSKWKEK